MKHLGIIAITLTWIGTLFLLRSHGADHTKTISKHAAKDNKHHITYAILEIAAVSIFAVFIYCWFMPHLTLPLAFSVFGAIGIIGTIIAAIIPDRAGWRGIVHGSGAYGMAISLLIMLIILGNSISAPIPELVIKLSVGYMIVSGCLMIFYPRVRNRMLIFQALYFVFFQLSILSATYL